MSVGASIELTIKEMLTALEDNKFHEAIKKNAKFTEVVANMSRRILEIAINQNWLTIKFYPFQIRMDNNYSTVRISTFFDSGENIQIEENARTLEIKMREKIEQNGYPFTNSVVFTESLKIEMTKVFGNACPSSDKVMHRVIELMTKNTGF
jgi:hypothetical protein